MMYKIGVHRRMFAVFCTAALAAGIAAGCGSGGGGQGGGGPAAGSGEAGGGSAKPQGEAVKAGPIPISMMNIFHDTEPPKPDNEAVRLIQEYTGTKLDVTWVPSTAYGDKVNATIASGQLPQVLLVTANKSTATINAVRSGMFWEVGPHLKSFPNLGQMNSQVLNNISVDGKVYGLYRHRPLARYGVIIRKDWLDKLGLPEPKTVDDLYNVAKAFTLNDPDGNGKHDTYGIAEDKSIGVLSQISLFMGAPNGWGEKDGKLQPSFLYPEYVDAMKRVRGMFQEKLMTQDFAVAKKFDLINQGKAGMYFSVLDDAATKHNELFKLNPNAELDVIAPIGGPMGERVLATTGYNGVFMFPKTSVKTEEELKGILGFFDKLADEPMQNLLGWGVEGKHYAMSGDKATQTAEQGKLFAAEINPIRQIKWDDDMKAKVGEETPITAKYKKLYVDNEKFAVGNGINPYLSQTAAEKGAELGKLIDDAVTKYIMGAIDDAGFNQAVEQWRKKAAESK